MEKIQEVFVILDNKAGELYKLTRILKKKRMQIYGIGVFEETARLHVSRPDVTQKMLEENGYNVELRDVLEVIIPNRHGALMDITQKLGNAGVNIEYLYSTLIPKQKKVMVVLEVDNPDLAIKLFENHRY